MQIQSVVNLNKREKTYFLNFSCLRDLNINHGKLCKMQADVQMIHLINYILFLLKRRHLENYENQWKFIFSVLHLSNLLKQVNLC